MKGQVTIYPSPEVKRAIEEIAEDDHDRPVSHVAEMALRAWVMLYREDKYNALKLADSFDKSPTPTRRAG